MFPEDISFGVGTWAWGERLIWDFGREYGTDDLSDAFRRYISDGIRFFSTSPAFAEGDSEKILGKFNAGEPSDLLIATKYVPRLWSLKRSDFLDSLKQSLLRLNLTKLPIYEICPPSGRMTLSRLAECAAEALDLHLIDQVGLSGFNASQIDYFNEALSRFGYSIACLEIPYNLLDRSIESNGTMEICRSLNIRIIAQQPLAMGMLTGKYDAEDPAAGNRRQMMLRYHTPRLDILLRTMNHIGLENNGKNCAQVALNWILCKGIVPIPGTKSLPQAIENAQTPGWRMTEEQMALLDTLTGSRKADNSSV
ncbi:MAG: aldo/keto reductase [Anaerolineaceae bacterium]|nr:aldo/keto reductase [Anaerolineaceae bacterium]